MILEPANQLLDPSFEGISNKNLNTADATNKDAAACPGNVDLTETEAKTEMFTRRICEENEGVVSFKPCGHNIRCTGI